MPAYRYEALDVDGKAAKGLVEADSAKAARSQLRGLAGVSDARWALVPLELGFVSDGAKGARVRLVLAVVDVRGSQVLWGGEVVGDASTEYSFAAIVSAVQRAADLVVPR